MFNKIFLVILLIMFLLLSSCNSKRTDDIKNSKEQTTIDLSIDSDYETRKETFKDTVKYLDYPAEDGVYAEEEIIVEYPQIINLLDVNKQEKINDLIKIDIMTWIEKSDEGPISIPKITYEIKFKSKNLLSIRYFISTYSVDTEIGGIEPFEYVSSININIEKGEIINLADLINLDDRFVSIYHSEKVKPMQEELVFDEEYEPSDDDIISTFKSCDSFYMTEDSLIFNFWTKRIPLEYEAKYQDIIENIKFENVLWNNFPELKSSSGQD